LLVWTEELERTLLKPTRFINGVYNIPHEKFSNSIWLH